MKNSEPIAQYFHETLGMEITPLPWEKAGFLPIYLQDNYTFKTIQIYGITCLLAFNFDHEEQSPTIIRKQMDQLRAKFDGEVIYVAMKMSSHNRKRFIQQKIPFVVPGNQMYLPTLGIDLREHFKSVRSQPEQFSPAAQLTLLHIILGDFKKTYHPKELAEEIGYSAMTMSRVFDELKIVAEISKQGRERLLRFQGDKQNLWERIAPRLSSPVQKRIHVPACKISPRSPQAGLSALSHYSSLAEPVIPVYAIRNGLTSAPIKKSLTDPNDQEATEVEIWLYNPQVCAQNGFVDPLSLYLSLQGSQDVRVESALEEMMRRLVW